MNKIQQSEKITLFVLLVMIFSNGIALASTKRSVCVYNDTLDVVHYKSFSEGGPSVDDWLSAGEYRSFDTNSPLYVQWSQSIPQRTMWKTIKLIPGQTENNSDGVTICKREITSEFRYGSYVLNHVRVRGIVLE